MPGGPTSRRPGRRRSRARSGSHRTRMNSRSNATRGSAGTLDEVGDPGKARCRTGDGQDCRRISAPCPPHQCQEDHKHRRGCQIGQEGIEQSGHGVEEPRRLVVCPPGEAHLPGEGTVATHSEGQHQPEARTGDADRPTQPYSVRRVHLRRGGRGAGPWARRPPGPRSEGGYPLTILWIRTRRSGPLPPGSGPSRPRAWTGGRRR